MFHPYTCPKIDRNIDDFKGSIEDFLRDLMTDLVPSFEGTDKFEEILQEASKNLYELAEPVFENTRQSNEDLRSSAEAYVDTAKAELDEAERELQWYKDNA